MAKVNPLVEQQYAEWIYPEPTVDIAALVALGGMQWGDPFSQHAIMAPERRYNPKMSLLVAGCGTSQAAILAYTNPKAKVVGIDLSEASLAHSAMLKEKHALSNLELHRLDLHKVAELGRTFDMITSTGVLHHLPDPEKGLEALAGVLAEDGVMHLMLYGKYLRIGVYMVQDALRRMGIEQNPEGVAFARTTIGALPAWHSAQSYMRVCDELHYDGAIVDTFLHKQDRAYTVPEILELSEKFGLTFQCWLDNLDYYPDGMLAPGHPLLQKIAALPKEEQWAVVELLAQSLGTHRFVLRKKGKDDARFRMDVEGDGLLTLVPARRVRLEIKEDGENIIASRNWHSLQVSGLGKEMLLAVDGKRTIGAIITKFTKRMPELEPSAREFFRHMYRLGHITLSKVAPY